MVLTPIAYTSPKLPKLDRYSLVACSLTTLANGNALSTASGFIWTRDGRHFLITNWHVLSGLNAISAQPMHKSLACPDKVRVKAWRRGDVGYILADITIDLVDAQGQSTWIEHPVHGRAVDVAAIYLLPQEFIPNIKSLNELPDTLDMAVHVGSDVFILGWPLSPDVVGPAPIWKRGTIASEPSIANMQGEHHLLVDTATRPGMSGSLVIARSLGMYQTESGDQIGKPGPHSRFIGVYSGRLGGEDPDKVQLGIAWHAYLIDEIISGSKFASVTSP